MFNQVGNLKLEENGTAIRGLIVRHLILPGQAENSLRALDNIREISQEINISLMSQYEPVFKAKDFSEINRRLESAEYEKVFNYLLELKLDNGWVQKPNSQAVLLPDFTRPNPFDKEEQL